MSKKDKAISKIPKIIGLSEEEMQQLETANTIEEVKDIYRASPRGSQLEVLALDKWDKDCMRQLEAASTIEEVKDIYSKTPNDSQSQAEAIRRMFMS